MEERMQFEVPKYKEPNKIFESSIHRSHSAATKKKKSQEYMNELEGIERQDVKIMRYTRNDIKKSKLANGRVKQELSDESLIINGLHQKIEEQEHAINSLNEKYKQIEHQMLAQNEVIQYCKRTVDSEWKAREEELRKKLAEQCSEKFETLLEERVKYMIKQRKEEVTKLVLELATRGLNNNKEN